MPHSIDHATRWLKLTLEQELPQHNLVRLHASRATITDLCTCGCHSFALHIADNVDLPSLSTRSGLYCELAFDTDCEHELNILMFTDKRGYLSQFKVQFHACNLGPVPDDLQILGLAGIWAMKP